ncbi:MAG: 2-oxo acid dehydrogenase subunit E2 [Candidatus Marinimicrobia bacterium]|nr:2-oxo acid dehydrogenase subunit E2 [Candidatus Neomarinimicrobiota bacterium]
MAQILLPELGEGISSVEISDVSVKVGDNISVDDILIVVETDKASMEIPATEAGEISIVHITTGDTLSPGEAIVTLTGEATITETNDDTEEPPTEVVQKEATETPQVPPVSTEPIESPVLANAGSTSASPSVRRFARELGCNLSDVSGTGIKGRITKEDVESYIKKALQQPQTQNIIQEVQSTPAQKPEIDFTQWGGVSRIKLNKIKRVTGDRLQEAWQTIPHVTQFDKADITELDKIRKSLKAMNTDKNIKVSHLPFFMKAVVKILQTMPEFNSSLSNDGKELILKSFINIGVAVDTPNGLVVPVIKDVDKKSLKQLTLELSKISEKARLGKLLPAEMQGGCFTISSLGGVGGTYFTPIINPPEVAIMGISRMMIEPVFINKKFVPRKMLPFSLSYDHRVIDGVTAVKFTRAFATILEDLNSLT